MRYCGHSFHPYSLTSLGIAAAFSAPLYAALSSTGTALNAVAVIPPCDAATDGTIGYTSRSVDYRVLWVIEDETHIAAGLRLFSEYLRFLNRRRPARVPSVESRDDECLQTSDSTGSFRGSLGDACTPAPPRRFSGSLSRGGIRDLADDVGDALAAAKRRDHAGDFNGTYYRFVVEIRDAAADATGPNTRVGRAMSGDTTNGRPLCLRDTTRAGRLRCPHAPPLAASRRGKPCRFAALCTALPSSRKQIVYGSTTLHPALQADYVNVWPPFSPVPRRNAAFWHVESAFIAAPCNLNVKHTIQDYQ
ncbi:hypothetical protein EV715DRAFT_268542, partial [Schizophyllum commune]